MYYYTYCIDFLQGSLKGKRYFGRRKSKLEPEKDTKYIGSGVIPRDYFRHFEPSEETYIKTILCTYNSLGELIKAEQQLLDEHVGKDYCVNINIGAIGGISKHNEETKEKCRRSNLGARWMNNGKVDKYVVKDKISYYLDLGYTFGRIYKASEEILKQISKKLKGRTNWLKDNKLPDYCKKHLSELNKDTKLMNNGERHKLVKYEDVDNYLINGWKLGHINKIDNKNKCIYWINNGKENKRVKKEELPLYYSKGYKTGRF